MNNCRRCSISKKHIVNDNLNCMQTNTQPENSKINNVRTNTNTSQINNALLVTTLANNIRSNSSQTNCIQALDNEFDAESSNIQSNALSQNNSRNNCTDTILLESLCGYIGSKCTCEFEVDNGLESKTGILEGVGKNYLILKSTNNSKIMYCDTSNLRFVTISC